MGDRSCGSVYVRGEFAPLMEQWLEAEKCSGYYQVDEGDGLYCVIDDESSYGEMEQVRLFLEDLEIPYDHEWSAGFDYEAGAGWYRPGYGYRRAFVTDGMIHAQTVAKYILDETFDRENFENRVLELAERFGPLKPRLRETEITEAHRQLIAKALKEEVSD